MNASLFFATHPVFSMEEAAKGLSTRSGASLRERLRYHVRAGRLVSAGRGVYAVVPPGTQRGQFRPDPFLVGVATRPDAVFSHHSALELLGLAHSAWNVCTLYTSRRRRSLFLSGSTVKFLEVPAELRGGRKRDLGLQKADRDGKLLRATGPERTLVEGFHQPALVGGFEELILSIGGVPVLDLGLLQEVLKVYGVGKLWAAVGWFLERNQRTFDVPERVLAHMERRRLKQPCYLDRGTRGGTLSPRWNLILPEAMSRLGGPDEA